MQFIYPEFLYALGFLALPIIIHLFNFKRFKTIYFPDVRFLSEIKNKSRSTSKLKHLLALLMRLLFVACLVIAFAQPFIKENGENIKKGKVGVQIYLDNSFSMQAQAKQGSLIEEAKQRAYTIINTYSASDRYQLVSNLFINDPSRWLNKDEVIAQLQNIDINHQSRSLKQVIDRMQESKSDEVEQKEIYLISDFQKSNFDLNEIDTIEAGINFVFLGASDNDNISLQNLKFEKPFHLAQQIENLSTEIIRHGKSDKVKIPVKLFLQGSLKAPLSVEFERADTVLAELSFQSTNDQMQKGKLLIKDYPITFDDTIYFNFSIKEEINIVHLYDETQNPNIEALFLDDSLFSYQALDIKQINYSEIEKSSLLILDQLGNLSSGAQNALIGFVRNGGDLVFIPASEETIEPGINEFLAGLNIGQLFDLQEGEKEMGGINQNAAIYKDVFESIPKNLDLPKVGLSWLVSENSNNLREDLITFKNADPFLRSFQIAKGQVYLFSAPIDVESSTFSRHALFVPTFYNIALYSQKAKRLYYDLDETTISLSDIQSSESPIHMLGHGIDLIPQQEYKNGELVLRLDNNIKKAGHYELRRDDQLIAIVSLNYSRSESDYRLTSSNELKEITDRQELSIRTYDQKSESLNQAIQNSKQGTPLWKYFIILALIFLGFEILLLRLFK